MKIYNKIKECRICKNRNLKIIIDLKSQYIQGSFIKKNYPKPYSKKIPLKLILCKKCFLVQLLHTTNKEIVNREKEYIKKGGSLIFPLPKIQIINKRNLNL